MEAPTDADLLAHRLSDRIDELARALAAAGASDADRCRLLESAAMAAMHAVSLEALTAYEPPAPRRAAGVRPPRRLSRAA